MKNLFLLSILILAGFFCFGQKHKSKNSDNEVDSTRAMLVALNFAYEAFAHQRGQKYEAIQPKIQYVERGRNNKPLLYFINVEPTGYLIVSGDDRCYPILSYSDEDLWSHDNYERLPKGAQFLISGYGEQIEIVIDSDINASFQLDEIWGKYSDKSSSKKRNEKSIKTLPEMGVINWDQCKPFNDDCPVANVWDYSGCPNYRVPSGCVAVGMAQLMKYWQWPPIGSGSNSYTDPANSADQPCNLADPSYLIQSANFGTTLYNWSGMKDILFSNESNEYVATLMFHAGVSVDMNYAYCQSDADIFKVDDAFVNNFRYSQNADLKDKSWWTWDTWEGYLKSEIDQGRPVIYFAQKYNYPPPLPNVGHAFICWAYEEMDTYTRFKFNWGEGGGGNGTWYTLRNVTGETIIGYQYDQKMIKNVYPDGSSIYPCNYFTIIEETGPEYEVTYMGGGEGAWYSSTNGPCGTPSSGVEQIYGFVAPTTGVYSLEVTEANGFVNYMWKTGSCSTTDWNCLAPISVAGTWGAMEWTAGETYWILLDDQDHIPGRHKFYINEPVPLPNITLSPGSHTFPNTPMGSCSGETSFTLKNEGGGTATGNVALSGTNQNQFSITEGSGSFSLGANQSKTIKVKFCPTSIGEKSANLSANGTGSTNSINSTISGECIQPPSVYLYNGYVTPSSGFTGETYSFKVSYKNTNGIPPDANSVKIHITDTFFEMNAGGSTWTSGVEFSKNLTVNGAGNHEYYFTGSVGGVSLRYPSSGFLNLSVTQNAVGWDAAVTEVTASKYQFSGSSSITAYGKIKNQSNSPDKVYTNLAYTFKVFDPNGTQIHEASGTIDQLTQLQVVTKSTTFTVSSSAPNGMYQVVVTISPALDSNPQNNTGIVSLYKGEVSTIEQYGVLNSNAYVQFLKPPNYLPNSYSFAGSTWNIVGLNHIDDYVILNRNGSSQHTIDVDDIETYDGNLIMIACHLVTQQGAWLSFGQNNQSVVNFESVEINGYPGQEVEFTAHSGYSFSGGDPSFFNNSYIEDWFDDTERFNNNQSIKFIFDIPSSATTGNKNFYLASDLSSTYSFAVTKLRIKVLPPVPVITSLSSYSFSADDQITITGSNFGTSQGSVKFNSLNGSIVSWSNTSITCTVPVGVANGLLTVVNSGGTSNPMSYQVISSTGNPEVINPIPDQALISNIEKYIANLNVVFQDPNGQAMTFSVSTTDPEVTFNQSQLNNGHLYLIATGSAQNSSSVTVTATDITNKTASDQFNVTIQCMPFNVPIFENFDAVVPPALPECWSKIEIGESAGVNSTTDNSHSTPNSLNMSFWTGDHAILISPRITQSINELRVKFNANADFFSYFGTSTIEVGTISDPSNFETFEVLTNVVLLENIWGQYYVYFDDYLGNNEYIAFRYGLEGVGFNGSVFIDNILIEMIPSCLEPISLSSGQFSSSSALLSWDTQGNEDAWDVEWGLNGFNPGQGNLVQEISDNPYLLSGLQAGTTYDYYIRSNCGSGDVSNWEGPLTFTTAFIPPYYQDFDANLDLPQGWNGDFSVHANRGINNTNALSQNFFMFLGGGGNTNGLVESPVFELLTGVDYKLVFSYRFLLSDNTPYQPGDGMSFNIDISMDQGISYTPLHSINNNNHTPSTDYVLVEIDINSFSGYAIVRFEHPEWLGMDDYFIDIDSFTIIPFCSKPTNLTAGNITNNSTNLSWDAGSNESQWDVIYGLSGFDPETQGTLLNGITLNPYMLVGLEANTTYDVYVRAVCGEGFVSEWAGPVNFTTLASELSVIPDSINFGEVTINECHTLSYQVTGTGLTDDVTITAPAGFQVSTQPEMGFEDIITVVPVDGSVGQTIYVRFCPVEVGEYSGEITNVSAGAETKVVEVSGYGQWMEAPYVTPASLTATLMTHTSATQTLTLTNPAGGGMINWHAAIIENGNRKFPENLGSFELSDPILMKNSDPNIDACDTSYLLSGDQSRGTWDILQSFSLNAASQVGIATDGNFLYSSTWNVAGRFSKYTLGGVWLEDFTIPGVGGIRDLTYDGQYFYGGAASTLIYQLDLANKSLVGTISSPVSVRHISYDPQNDAFWCGNWTTLRLVNRSGATLFTGPSVVGVYGSAYDNNTPGGPYLWLFAQNATAGCGGFNDRVQIQQFSITENALTDVFHCAADIPGYIPGVPGSNTLAGGAFTTDQLIPGKFVLMVNIQQTPNLIGIYDLSNMGSWLTLDSYSGSLNPGDSQNIEVTFNASGLSPDTYEVIIRFEPQSSKEKSGWLVDVPVTVTVDSLICNPPTDLYSFEATQSTATIGWLAGGDESEWEIILGIEGFDPALSGVRITEIYSNSYFLQSLAPGTGYSFYVRSVCAIGIGSSWSGPQSFTTEPRTCNPPDDFTAVQYGEGALLTWIPPMMPGIDSHISYQFKYLNDLQYDEFLSDIAMISIDESPVINKGEPSNGKNEIVMHYDGENVTSIGYGSSGGWLFAAARFPAESIQQYIGHTLARVLIYIGDAPQYSMLKIWTGGSINGPGSLIYEQWFVSKNDSWNTVELITPVELDGSDIWIGYLCILNSGQYSAGADAGPANPNGDYYSANGQTWTRLSSASIDRNFNIRGVLVSELCELTGFNVYRDGVVIANTNAEVLEYLDSPLIPGVYSYELTANYGLTNPFESIPIGPVEVVINEYQLLSVNQGWSGISTFISPTQPNVQTIFYPILSDLIILQSETGMYWPGENVNTIGAWSTHEGYKIKVANAIELTILQQVGI